MGSFNSSALQRNARLAARSAAEAGIAGGLLVAAAAAIFTGPALRKGLFIGSGCAWAASSLSTTALLVSRAHKSAAVKAFWYAFGGGMALRFAVLVALMAYCYQRPVVSQSALLLAYAFGILFFLLLEYRHIKIK